MFGQTKIDKIRKTTVLRNPLHALVMKSNLESLDHYAFSNPGDSGAPIWVQLDGVKVIVGVISRGDSRTIAK